MKPRRLLLSIFFLVGAVFGSVPSSTTWVQYVLTTNPQTLTVPFVFQNASDLLVLDSKASPPVTLTLNSDYSVSGGSGSTGTIATIAGGANAVQVGDKITISRRVPITQTTSFVTGGPLTPAMIGQTVDKLTTIAQQLNLVGANSLQFQGDEQISGVLPLNSRKGAFLAFDANGIPWFPTTASIVGSVTNPIVANSIAALRVVPTASLVNNAVCQVTGYYAANDGGGGTYVWNSTSTALDNGGTVIQATGVATGRWLLQTDSPYDPKQFGAKGNGTDLDYTAMQAAVTAAIADSQIVHGSIDLSTNSGLSISKGIYPLSSAVTGSIFSMVISSPNGAVLSTTGSTPAISVTNSNHLTIENLQIYGGSSGVVVSNPNYDATVIVFRNCTFCDINGIAVDLEPSGGNTHLSANVVFEHCRFYNCAQFVKSYADYTTFTDCWFYAVAGTATNNLPVSSASFLNYSIAQGMFFNTCTFVPGVGTGATHAYDNSRRWIDNLGTSGIYADECRFGYEAGGRPIVYNFVSGLSASSQNPTDLGRVSFVFRDCPQLSGGDVADAGAIVMLVQGIPNKVLITGCTGPSGSSVINDAHMVQSDGITPTTISYWLDPSRCANYKMDFVLLNNNIAAFAGQVLIPAELQPNAIWDNIQFASGSRQVNFGCAVSLASVVGNLVATGTGSFTTSTDGNGMTVNFPVAATGSNGSAINFKSWTGSAALVPIGQIKAYVTDGSASYASNIRLLSATAGGLQSAGDFAPTGWYAPAPISLKSYTVAQLPAASGYPGGCVYVTDLTSITSGAAVTGGGSLKHVVASDGTNWIVQ